MVFDRNNGEIICDFLPDRYSQNVAGGNKKKRQPVPLLRKLVASAIDVTPEGRIMIVKMRDNKYYI